jgi:RimJ/RimL family protein N-acetyltransferase
MAVVLRPVQGTDMDAMFGMLSDPDSRQMAPFVRLNFANRAEFDALIEQFEADPRVMLYSELASGHFVGACMTFDGDLGREIFYWIRRIAWGRGLATDALTRLLRLDHTRPIYARVVASNERSQATLRKVGFKEVRRHQADMDGDGIPEEEVVYVFE